MIMGPLSYTDTHRGSIRDKLVRHGRQEREACELSLKLPESRMMSPNILMSRANASYGTLLESSGTVTFFALGEQRKDGRDAEVNEVVFDRW